MRGLSISMAWDEAKAILARDGRLLMTVALALVALPAAINSFINPSMNSASAPLWADGVALVATLIALAGQLALIRLALGPSITVGGAIAHGIRRMPVYLVSVLAILIGLLLAAIPLVFLLALLGVPIETKGVPPSPATVAVALFYFVLAIFVGVRLILSAPVASAEPVGPIAILRRSWSLTAGNYWPLLGFLAIFLVGAIIILLAIGSAVGVTIGLLFGSIQPLSASALIVALVQALVSSAITTLFAVMLARIYLQLAGGGEQVR